MTLNINIEKCADNKIKISTTANRRTTSQWVEPGQLVKVHGIEIDCKGLLSVRLPGAKNKTVTLKSTTLPLRVWGGPVKDLTVDAPQINVPGTLIVQQTLTLKAPKPDAKKPSKLPVGSIIIARNAKVMAHTVDIDANKEFNLAGLLKCVTGTISCKQVQLLADSKLIQQAAVSPTLMPASGGAAAASAVGGAAGSANAGDNHHTLVFDIKQGGAFNQNAKFNVERLEVKSAHAVVRTNQKNTSEDSNTLYVYNELHASQKCKITSAQCTLNASVRAPYLTVATDALDAEQDTLVTNNFRLRGMDASKTACKNIKNLPIVVRYSHLPAEGNAQSANVPDICHYRLVDDSKLREQHTKTRVKTIISTTDDHTPCAVDTLGEVEVRYTGHTMTDEGTPVTFTVQHPYHVGGNSQFLVGQATIKFKKPEGSIFNELRCGGQLTLKAHSCEVEKTRVYALGGMQVALDPNQGQLTLNGKVVTSAINETGFSTVLHALKHTHPHLYKAHYAKLHQQMKTQRDGTALVSGGDVSFSCANISMDHAAFFSMGAVHWQAEEGAKAPEKMHLTSSVWFSNSAALAMREQKLTSNTTGDISTTCPLGSSHSVTSNYILSPLSAFHVQADHRVAYQLQHQGSQYIVDGIADMTGEHNTLANLASTDTHEWQEMTHGRKRARAWGRRKKKYHTVKQSACAEIYIGKLSVDGNLSVEAASFKTQGQVNAHNITGKVGALKVDFESRLSEVDRTQQANEQLQAMSHRFMSAFQASDHPQVVYQLLGEAVQTQCSHIQKVIARSVDNNDAEVLSADGQKKLYSDAIEALLTRHFFTHVLGKNISVDELRKNASQVPGAVAGANGTTQLSPEHLAKYHKSCLYYKEQIIGEGEQAQAVLVPHIHLGAHHADALKQQPVAVMHADKRIQMINLEDGSTVECLGLVEGDDIYLHAEFVTLAQQLEQQHATVTRNKRDGKITATLWKEMANTGKIDAKKSLTLRGKRYVQVGGELASAQGGTYVEMVELASFSALETSATEQHKVTKGGKCFALVPNFVTAKIISVNNQTKVVVQTGDAVFEGSRISGDSVEIVTAGDTRFSAATADYQTACTRSYRGGRISRQKQVDQAHAANTVEAQRFSAQAGGDFSAEATHFAISGDMLVNAKNIDIAHASCERYLESSGYRYSKLALGYQKQQSHWTRAILSSAFIGGNLTLRAEERIKLRGLYGVVGENFSAKAKTVQVEGATTTTTTTTHSTQLGVEFFGSEALSSLLSNEKAQGVLSALANDVPLMRAVMELTDCHSGADLTLSSVKTFLETLRLASMASTAMNAESGSLKEFCGQVTDALDITKINKATQEREFNPAVTLRLSQMCSRQSETKDIGVFLKVNGTILIEGDEVIIQGGSRLKAQDIIILAKQFQLACGEHVAKQHLKNQRVGVTANVRDGSGVNVSADAQYSSQRQTKRIVSALEAENDCIIHATDSASLYSAKIKAAKIWIATQTLTLVSKQDTFSSTQRAAGAHVAMDGSSGGAHASVQSQKVAQARVLTELLATESIDILAEKLIQAGSIIHSDNKLNIEYLYGQPVLATRQDDVVDKTDNADDDDATDTASSGFRACYFLRGLISPVKTNALYQVLSLANTEAPRELLNNHLYSLWQDNNGKKVFQESFIGALEQWSRTPIPPAINACRALMSTLTNTERDADFDVVWSKLSAKDAAVAKAGLVYYYDFIRVNHAEISSNKILFCELIEKLNPDAVVWYFDPSRGQLVHVMGDDTKSGHSHYQLGQDGKLYALFKTSNTQNSLDWQVSDIKNYNRLRQLSASVKLGQQSDCTATAKQTTTTTTTPGVVSAAAYTGAPIPEQAKRTVGQAHSKKTKHSVGLFYNHRAAKRLCDQLGLDSPTSTAAATPAKQQDAAKQAQSDIPANENYHVMLNFLEEKLYTIACHEGLPVTKTLVSNTVSLLFHRIAPSQLRQYMTSATHQLYTHNPHFKAFSDDINNGSPAVEPACLSFIWMGLHNLQTQVMKNQAAAASSQTQPVPPAPSAKADALASPEASPPSQLNVKPGAAPVSHLPSPESSPSGQLRFGARSGTTHSKGVYLRGSQPQSRMQDASSGKTVRNLGQAKTTTQQGTSMRTPQAITDSASAALYTTRLVDSDALSIDLSAGTIGLARGPAFAGFSASLLRAQANTEHASLTVEGLNLAGRLQYSGSSFSAAASALLFKASAETKLSGVCIVGDYYVPHIAVDYYVGAHAELKVGKTKTKSGTERINLNAGAAFGSGVGVGMAVERTANAPQCAPAASPQPAKAPKRPSNAHIQPKA